MGDVTIIPIRILKDKSSCEAQRGTRSTFVATVDLLAGGLFQLLVGDEELPDD
jgi:hypothetical protein